MTNRPAVSMTMIRLLPLIFLFASSRARPFRRCRRLDSLGASRSATRDLGYDAATALLLARVIRSVESMPAGSAARRRRTMLYLREAATIYDFGLHLEMCPAPWSGSSSPDCWKRPPPGSAIASP
ncbi:hypothetical protein [Paractinoplanes rishiriensis]|uniref:hypothetical protein n=1 Tax=Paractinoplanes rishiriensis TaxID=1050105 RepID=UPI0019448B62|nr:hypothetical protein [Actinoplanes rishiriensis]